MKLIALSAIVTMVAACQAEQPLRVHETIKSIHALNGKTVRVAGYLGICAGYDCHLYENKKDKERANRWYKLVIAHEYPQPVPPEIDRPPPDALGIGTGELICRTPNARDEDCYFEFDRKAAPFWNSYVVITGKVTNMCRDEQGRPGCTDRGTDLEPLAITAWTPTSGNKS